MPVTTRKKGGERTPGLPDHYPQLLLTIYFWRYATVPIVHRLFREHYTTKSESTVERHLLALASPQFGYLKRTIRSRNQHYVYSVTDKGRKLLRQHYRDQTFIKTREEATKSHPINHELAVSEVQTHLHLAIANHPHLTFLNYERRFFHKKQRLPYIHPDTGEQHYLHPDLGMLLKVADKSEPYPLLHMIEVDLGTESPETFFQKLLFYLWWYEQRGERYLRKCYQPYTPKPAVTFRLLVVTKSRSNDRDLHRLAHLYHLARQLPADFRRRIEFTTYDHLATSNLLTDPLWYPVRSTNPQPRTLLRP